MKKLAKKIFAALAAAVMAVTAVGSSVCADTADKAAFTGWIKEDKIQRRYQDGLPYTGWLNYSGGRKKYCLDGYLMKGDYIIDGKSYHFNVYGVSNGIYTVPALSAECGEVNPDTHCIDFTIFVNEDDGKTHSIPYPSKMERWEKGKWVKCGGDDYVIPDAFIYYSFQHPNTAPFYPRDYTLGNFYEGYYRITFDKRSPDKYYAYFKVSPSNEYKDGFVQEGTR
ncbi:MAG: hypothetical protein J1E40_00105, partial [Oscillospiraceae bacterium]|nr:hypothetical protein [Oscillospiraceae bacterium]